MKAYGLDESRIAVIPNAVSSLFRPLQREAAQNRIFAKYGIRSPFVLTIGDLQPRKNHMGLLEAFEQVLRANPELPHQLVMAGKDTWYSGSLRRAIRRSPIADRVSLPGFVEDEDLVDLYGACDVFVFPSFYEGFGLPILEAMACGRAVACSNTSAMPEVADGAAILFDPTSTAEIARAIRDLLLDSELRQRMERLGSNRAGLFSWEGAARKTLDVYYDVAGVKSQKLVRARAMS
jgi:glycosyltransferase involved in cell wall biosynthesis